MKIFYLLLSLFMPLENLFAALNCKDLPEQLQLKSVRTPPQSDKKFLMRFVGNDEEAECRYDAFRYNVFAGKNYQLYELYYGDKKINYYSTKDWLQFRGHSKDNYSLSLYGMKDPSNPRLWHSWTLYFNKTTEGFIEHEISLPAYLRQPGEVFETEKEEIAVIIER